MNFNDQQEVKPNFFLSLQTCYEMERYLKDEPKHHGSKNNKLSSDLDASPWDMFATPGGPLSGSWKMIDDKLSMDLDTLSTTSTSSSCSSRLSWDAPLSCAVVVKNEPMDEDYDDNSDGYEENSFTSSSSSSNKYHHQHHLSSSKNNNNNNNINNNTNSSSTKLLGSSNNLSSNVSSRNLESHHQNAIELTLLARSTLPTLTPPSSPEPNPKSLAISSSGQERKVLRISAGTQLPRNAIVRLTNGRNSIGVARLIHVNPKYQQNSVDSKNISSSVSTTGEFLPITQTQITAKNFN